MTTSDAPRTNGGPPGVLSMVTGPALLALAISVARLLLEFNEAPQWLARDGAGGLGAIIGIAWLPLIFGPRFALRLRKHYASTLRFVGRLALTLFAFGILSRIPVIAFGVLDLVYGWDTHYGAFPPEMAEESQGTLIVMTFVAQLVAWASIWTVGSGLVLGGIVVLVTRSSDHEAEEARA